MSHVQAFRREQFTLHDSRSLRIVGKTLGARKFRVSRYYQEVCCMKNVIVIIVMSLLVFGVIPICSGEESGEKCATQSGGKCKTVCAPNERSKQGAFLDCTKEEKCCVSGKTSARHLKQISGQVTAIDRGEKSITVGGITILADEKMLANIKEGDKVKVDYYSRGVHRAIFILREVK